VPWRVITDMRNRVSHGYFDIDLDTVSSLPAGADLSTCGAFLNFWDAAGFG
jgi:Protein of unknown function DUF86